MSKRPIQDKKINSLKRLLHQTPPSYINLIEWLRDHKHAQTTGQAKRLLTQGKVKVDSHTVGRIAVPTLAGETEFVASPFIQASLRSQITVIE